MGNLQQISYLMVEKEEWTFSTFDLKEGKTMYSKINN